MKVVILAGGLGSRISEADSTVPKPLLEIGGMPILWHIMKSYSACGFRDFIICCGYKQDKIKDFFSNYFSRTSDVTYDFSNQNKIITHENFSEPWKVSVIDTGMETQTGGRIKRIQPYVQGETFCMTYGDGLCSVDMRNVVDFHKSHGKIATITSVNISQRFGMLHVDDTGKVLEFREKDDLDRRVINGGYMVFEPQVFDYISGDLTVLEEEPLARLAKDQQLMAYHYDGFWKCMDTRREWSELNAEWTQGKARWKTW